MSFTVIETWHLTDEAAKQATRTMQLIDDALGDNAHGHPGWNGHASFLQDQAKPNEVTWIYPWRSEEDHVDLLKSEEPIVQPLIEQYCTRPRTIRYAAELPVEVEHDHQH
jgi:heme-degrading monooxygenase HmoA